MMSRFQEYIAEYTIANFWRCPIRRRVIYVSALELLFFAIRPALAWLSVCQSMHLSCNTTKPTKWSVRSVRPARTQISQGIRPVWSVFVVRLKKDWVLSYTLSALRRRMPRLIWVFTGHTYHFVDFVVSQFICSSDNSSIAFKFFSHKHKEQPSPHLVTESSDHVYQYKSVD